MLTLFLVSCNAGNSMTAPVPPTETAVLASTLGPIQVVTPDPQFFRSVEPVGFISIPGVGDAGNYFLDSGSTITLTWNDPPPGAARYDFTLLDFSGLPMVIGTDIDPSDGVSTQWLVPENLSGSEVRGLAYASNGQAQSFAYGGAVYSGVIPPQTICTLGVQTTGALSVYPEPDLSSESFAYLIAGQYAKVHERTSDGWYHIDAGEALDIQTNQPAVGTGWVFDNHEFRLFGPCGRFK